MIQFTLADDDSKIYGGDGNTDDLYIYGGNTGLPYLYLDGDAYVDINVDGGDYFRILENSNEVLRFQDTGPDSMIEAVTASQNINLTSGAGGKIEIYNVLHITPQPTAPAGAISGDMYFDSTNNTLCVYGDGGWVGLW